MGKYEALVHEIPSSRLPEYAGIPIAFTVNSIFRLEAIKDGLGGIQLVEEQVSPYVKDYDALEGGSPVHWAERFDIRKWGLFLVSEHDQPLGGAVVAWNTPGVDMLEGGTDQSVLWDIRVRPEFRGRGIGEALFWYAVQWSRERQCTQMKVETQNTNVPACRFYAGLGCQLGDIRRYAYRNDPVVSDEVQLNWYYPIA